MEASQATAQGGEAAAESAEQQYVTADQFNALTAGQDELKQALQTIAQQVQQPQPTPEAEPQVPEMDLSFLEDDGYDDTQVAERLAQTFQQQVDAAIQQRVEPLQQQIQEQQHEREAQALVDEFPELATKEVQDEVLGLASELIQTNGWPQEMIHDPKFWRMTYMTAKAVKAANAETGAESRAAAHLEGGGGATPAGSQVDPAQAIIDAGRSGRSVLPF
jgi:hypothetical protein